MISRKARTIDLLAALDATSRRAYVESHLQKLAPPYKPRYEGGWWYEFSGHYPRNVRRDHYSTRDAHSGTTRSTCPECWQARLKEVKP